MLIIKKEKDGIIESTYKSSDIKSSEFDLDKRQLKLNFVKGNKTYLYENVNPQDYYSFQNSKSQGKGFVEFIKKYKHKTL